MPTALAEKPPAHAHVAFTPLEKAAVAALRKLVSYDHKRTAALKEFALSLANIRKEMNDPAGTSQAYRDTAARIYAAVEIPPDSQSTLQASIRYHIGNVIREVFTPEELTAVGLSEKTPLERARDARNTPAPPVPATAPADAGAVTVQVLPDAVVLAPVNPPKPARKQEKRDYAERPRPQIALPPNPVVLVGHALDIVRAAVSINVAATDVASMRDLARRLRLELDKLEAHLGASDQKTPSRSSRASKATTKAS